MASQASLVEVTGIAGMFTGFIDEVSVPLLRDSERSNSCEIDMRVVGVDANEGQLGPTKVSRTEGDNSEAIFPGNFNRDLVKLRRGLGDYGCAHYRRRCKIRAPCCGEVFSCRHCHNEAKNGDNVPPALRHDIPRHKVQTVVCSLCDTEQKVQQVCENCGVCMGDYFCSDCKFYDDDISKKQYHCDACGICRIGGQDKFFHCNKCGCCYALALKLQGHPCIENSMHHNCPVCFEYLFDSIRDITVMPCGHTIHLDCCKEMQTHGQYACPMCSKSMCDMSRLWAELDEEVALTPMPDIYRDKKVWILCNDCSETSEVYFHIVAQKCLGCRSYNTRVIKGVPDGFN